MLDRGARWPFRYSKGRPGRPEKSRGDQRRSWELISTRYIGKWTGALCKFHRGQGALLGDLKVDWRGAFGDPDESLDRGAPMS